MSLLQFGGTPRGSTDGDVILPPTLQALARAGGSDPRPLLSVRPVFGDLLDDEQLVGALGATLVHLERRGVRKTIRRALAATASGAVLPLDAASRPRARAGRLVPIGRAEADAMSA